MKRPKMTRAAIRRAACNAMEAIPTDNAAETLAVIEAMKVMVNALFAHSASSSTLSSAARSCAGMPSRRPKKR